MKLIFLDGSGRQGSYNRQLLQAFETQLRALEFVFEAEYISPSSHRVPNLIPNEDCPKSHLETCDFIRHAAMRAEGFVIESPEYNGGPTGGLKNLIDWMTRPNTAYPKGNPFVMKPTVLLSASTGALGGIKGLQVLRLIMGHLRALVLPEQVALPDASQAFNDRGDLQPGLPADLVKSAAQQFAEYLNTHKS